MYISELLPEFKELQRKYGSTDHDVIYGAGEVDSPKLFLVFMNPTARNVAASKDWEGLKAPWIGTKGVWKMLYDLDIIKNQEIVGKTQGLKPNEWTPEFTEELFDEVRRNSLYITNIAKCTQVDARPLPNSIFREYRPSFEKEIELVNPQKIITFGNQVSSIALEKQISVSDYMNDEVDVISIEEKRYNIYPCYYPVGQGRRNMPIAKERISKIVNLK